MSLERKTGNCTKFTGLQLKIRSVSDSTFPEIVWDNANSPFCKSQSKDVNSDWLADEWNERSVLGHAQIHKGRMKGDDPEIDTDSKAIGRASGPSGMALNEQIGCKATGPRALKSRSFNEKRGVERFNLCKEASFYRNDLLLRCHVQNLPP